MVLAGWVPADAEELFDASFTPQTSKQQAETGWTMQEGGPPRPEQLWQRTDGGAKDAWWAVQERQHVPALESGGSGATLSRPLVIEADEPVHVVIEYGWRAGRGRGVLEAALLGDGGRGARVVMRQQAGDKYEVFWDAGGEGASLGSMRDDTLDAGVQSGGVAESPAVVHLTLDKSGRRLGVHRLGGEALQVDLPQPLTPTRLVLTDTSPGQEHARIGRVRAFLGDVDPTREAAELTMPFGASFLEGDAPRFRVHGRWFSGEPRDATLELAAHPLPRTAGEEPVRVSLRATVDSGGVTEVEADGLRDLPPRLYALQGKMTVGRDELPVEARFAILSKELAGRPQDGIPEWVGVVPFINVLPRGVYGESFDYMHRLGVRHVRWLPGWGRLEPEENQYEWGESDEFMGLVAAHDMQAMFCLSYYGADWASDRTRGQLARTPEGRAMWVEKFAVPTIRRYGDRVKLWQIWNEPDAFWNDDPAKAYGFAQAFGTPANYYDLFARTHGAAHDLGIPDLRIMASLASGEIPHGIRKLFGFGLGERFDGMILHTYGPHVRHFETARKLLAELGHPDAALGSGEVGLPRGTGWEGSMRQARLVMQVMLGNTTIPNLLCVEWFVLHDRVAGGNLGLLNERFQPHPAAVAYHTVARLLSGATAGEMDVRGMLQVYRVQRAGRPPLVAIANTDNPTLMTFGVREGERPVVWDLLGRATRPEVRDGGFTLDVADAVMIEGDVSIKNAVSPAVAVSLATEGRPVVTVALGKGAELAGGRVTLSVPDAGFEETKPIDAAGSAAFELTQPLEPGRQYGGQITVAVGGVESAQATTIEATPVFRVTAEEARSLTPPEHLPAIRLTGEEFRPFNQKRVHGGPSDSGATIRLGWTPQEMVLWVEEEDDVHHRIPVAAPNPFGFDSGQWAFQPEGQLAPAAPSLEVTFGIRANGEDFARVLGQPHYSPAMRGEREGSTTRYRVTMPMSQLGIESAAGVSLGTAINLNDNDGDGRKGWLYWGNGINGQKNPAQFRRVVLQERPAPSAR